MITNVLLGFLIIAVGALRRSVRHLERKMTKAFDEMKEQLGTINTTVSEVADDIQALLDKLNQTPDQGLSMEEAAEIKGELASLKDRLTGVASQYPPADNA